MGGRRSDSIAPTSRSFRSLIMWEAARRPTRPTSGRPLITTAPLGTVPVSMILNPSFADRLSGIHQTFRRETFERTSGDQIKGSHGARDFSTPSDLYNIC